MPAAPELPVPPPLDDANVPAMTMVSVSALIEALPDALIMVNSRGIIYLAMGLNLPLFLVQRNGTEVRFWLELGGGW